MPATLSNSNKRLFSSTPIVSTEMISFQKDDFGYKLEETINIIYDKITKVNSPTDKKYVSEGIEPEVIILTDLINQRLGLKVKIITDSFFNMAAILPFYSNQNHIFLNEWFRGGGLEGEENHDKLFKQLKKRKEIKGTVDIEKAKVSGVFSEFENQLYMNFKQLINNKLTVQEITAVLLHELGHGFYACEYSNRLDVNNQILASVSQEIFSKKDNKDLVYIYKELKKINEEVKESDVEDIVSGKNVIPGLTFFKVVIGSVKNNITNDKYNNSSFEQLADNFSNRFGYGRPLVSGLQKIVGYSKFTTYFMLIATTMQNIIELSNIFQLLFLTLAKPLAITFMSLLFHVFIFLVLMFFIGEGSKDYTYDNIVRRYKRVRNDLVEGLKDQSINKESVAVLINTITEIDKIILNIDLPEDLFKKVVNIVLPYHYKAKGSINEQQLMEDLISNDIFIKSAQLRSL